MDLWVGAAAACAGYFAKHWQNLVPDVGTSDPDAGCPNATEASSSMRQLRDAAYARRQGKEKRVTQSATELLDGGFYDDSCLLPGEVASTSSLLSILNFPVGIPRCTEDNEYDEEISMLGNIGESSNRGLDQQTWEASTSHGSQWGRKSIRSRHIRPQLLKPLNSLESCLMAQLYRGHAQVEQHTSLILSSLTPTLRPFYVTDGTRIISKPSTDSYDARARGEKTMQQKDIFFHVNGRYGIPYLPKIEPGRGRGTQKLRRVQNQLGNATGSNTLVKAAESLRQGGSSRGAVLLYCGIFVGMLCTFMADKAEVENLKGLLKQSENLVEDLQEELEMKDSLTVKELVKDGDSVRNANDSTVKDKNLMADTTECVLEDERATKHDRQEADAQEEAEASGNLGSITNIEAELEAELERLELNMKESSLQRRLSDIMEIDPDSMAVSEVVHGELRADLVKAASESSSIHDLLSSTSTPDATKQAVSPHDLCLRLHEVIRSRLEQRIMELEAALDESQKRVRQLESERAISWREHVRSESSSTQDSPMARPLVMNLAGEALDAYNEAYEVLGGINVTGQDDDRLELDSDNQKKLYFFDDSRESMGSLYCDGRDEMANGSMLSSAVDEEAIRPDFRVNWKSKESTPSANEEKNSDDDDDAMGFLIRQLVEKARQGSPAVLQAHRAMVSLDRD
ncbi:hypothetical protein AKJ16_DCAP05973 [Drosera capensis]